MIQQYLIHTEIEIPVGDKKLIGNLNLPSPASGLVVFSHGSGSSRHSSRNRYVAKVLEDANFGTLLFDLLTEEEDQTYQNRFDIPLLTERLVTVTEWLAGLPQLRGLPVGYFGASTGAASALGAAAKLGDKIKAVVSRGGRPDLVLPVLPQVLAPTLLIVGEKDEAVIVMNEQAYRALKKAEKELFIIPGATHLFEEKGTLEEAARIATSWFEQYLNK
ncbi:DeoR faimly transcriptional regulator [Rufibacter radiotolerans]|uniref:DeoR faimly transcriptional regulator n=1 Tax=Rufibacter radiotolerans TaxID=1379910 RepID=A0A0H4VQ07_9BACT|nr:dienelactone hydrolase family protein [Rufibacter radiotolerans]AKQ46017.1 DeoR faimly transcriptional regulator [Rufibacter radiotolerans]